MEETRMRQDRLEGGSWASAVGRKVGAGARGLGEKQVAVESRLVEERRGVEGARLAQGSGLMADRLEGRAGPRQQGREGLSRS